jgi:tetratricopeptide (TPR) repeat protein
MEIEDNTIYVNNELVSKTKEYIIKCYENNNLTNNHADHMNLFNLGEYYCIIEDNYPKAVEYYEKSVEKGNIKALSLLGYYYHFIEINYPKAIEYYMMAIENGDSDVICDLADYYCDIEENYPEAIKYYMMGIEKGYDNAMCNLGCYYYDIENYPEAIKYYMMAIEKGNDMAMKNLGNYYNFIEENYPKAIKYYIMAFRNNNNNALKHLKEITTPLKRYKLFTDNDIDYTEPIDKDIQFYKNKLKNTSKLADCPVCLESKNCVLLNCFAHYICTDCYIELYNKPCPVCRS